MTNDQIADNFKLLAKLMDIHGLNSFKSKSYNSAAFSIEKLDGQLADFDRKNLAGLRGIGASSAKKIEALLDTGHLPELTALVEDTPQGILEMMQIKGIGPKKINTIWKEMEIESVGELLYACEENRLKLYKGFGEKTQTNIAQTLTYYLQSKDSHLYAAVEEVAAIIELKLIALFGKENVHVSGEFLRQMPVITQLEFVVMSDADAILSKVKTDASFSIKDEGELRLGTEHSIEVKIWPAMQGTLVDVLLKTSSTPEFYEAIVESIKVESADSLENLFKKINKPFIPAAARNNIKSLSYTEKEFAETLQASDIKGLIHSHSKWSDGAETIETMAGACIALGLEYMLITDHSKSAFYAQGLFPEKIAAQQEEIDALNKKLHPFRIFKGIESDILNDGSLDYDDAVLHSFDLIIASVHSNLKMPEEKAMSRLLTAIANPFTSILGHPTGRLLLSRKGYPLNFTEIIDSCGAHNVCIEINANPNRLDIDWEHIEYAKEKKVLLSVNPDAHSIAGINDIKYGVLVAQKGVLQKMENLSSFSLAQMEEFIIIQKAKRPK